MSAKVAPPEHAEKIRALSKPVFYPIPRDATHADFDRIADLIHLHQAEYDAALAQAQLATPDSVQ